MVQLLRKSEDDLFPKKVSSAAAAVNIHNNVMIRHVQTSPPPTVQGQNDIQMLTSCQGYVKDNSILCRILVFGKRGEHKITSNYSIGTREIYKSEASF